MTPEYEIVEIVKKTISNKFVGVETYESLSFPQLQIIRMAHTYCVRLNPEFWDDEICVKRFEKLKSDFQRITIEIRNLIIERPQKIVLIGFGGQVSKSPIYYNCVFNKQANAREFICHSCVYNKGKIR